MSKRSYQQKERRRQRKHVALDPRGQSPQTRQLSLTSTLFGKTGLEGWRTFDSLAPPQVYPAGTELFHQGARVEELCWIKQGIIKLIRVHEDGREMIMGLYLSLIHISEPTRPY